MSEETQTVTLDRVINKTKKDPDSATALQYILDLVAKETLKGEQFRINRSTVLDLIAGIDQKLSAQMDEIVHNEEFQDLEARWRGLYHLVDRTPRNSNVEILFCDATKKELASDMVESGADPDDTRMWRWLYEDSYGQLGGDPYGSIIAAYDFGPSKLDVDLMRAVGRVCQEVHAPFIANASAEFWPSLDGSFAGLGNMRSPTIAGNHGKQWNIFRDEEVSNWIALTLPRFMLRTPYSPDNPIPGGLFEYTERAADQHGDYLWGHTAFAFGCQLVESFYQHGWCSNIVGHEDSGGDHKGLPTHGYPWKGGEADRPATESRLADNKYGPLSEEGFIPFVYDVNSGKGGQATFYTAHTAKRIPTFPKTPQGIQDRRNYTLQVQLPYLMMVSRLAHYIKKEQARLIGQAGVTEASLQADLTRWVGQFITANEAPPADVVAKAPFKRIEITVTESVDTPGSFKVDMLMEPHLKVKDAHFQLSLVASPMKAAQG